MKHLLPLLLTLVSLSACVDEVDYDNNPQDNFEALWRIMDEHYCFFDYKQVDWDSVHAVYAERISEGMSEYALFDSLASMLSTLRDGHVNLYASPDVGRYWAWQEDYPLNFHEELQRHYLGTTYRIAGNLRYTILLPDSIGYIYSPTFASGYSDSGMDEALYSFRDCKALILDMRSNSGGNLTSAEDMATHFAPQTYTAGFIRHKTGKGHADFSTPTRMDITPVSGVRWLRPTILLTNRKVFSATNWLVNCLRDLPQIVQVGDSTGGGSGFPFSSELPNGWKVRYSASQMLNAAGEQIEFGIPPHLRVNVLVPYDFERKADNIIEAARTLLHEYFTGNRTLK
jgi:hypothetical protein